jgi:NADH-quinone oxidoreductase subunit C
LTDVTGTEPESEGDTPAADATADDTAADATADDAPEAEAAEVEAPEVEAAPDPHALDERHTQLLAILEAELGEAVLAQEPRFGDPVVRIRRDSWRRAGEFVKTRLDCDYLSFVSAIDWSPAPREGDEDSGDTSSPVQPQEISYGAAGSDGRFQVFAHVQSTSRNWGLTLKVDVDEQAMLAQSWVEIYAGADWHERETWEMFGVIFEGHPALRHLYLPSEFEGHPLRKEFALLSRVVKPWPGLVDVEPMPEEAAAEETADDTVAEEAAAESGAES